MNLRYLKLQLNSNGTKVRMSLPVWCAPHLPVRYLVIHGPCSWQGTCKCRFSYPCFPLSLAEFVVWWDTLHSIKRAWLLNLRKDRNWRSCWSKVRFEGKFKKYKCNKYFPFHYREKQNQFIFLFEPETKVETRIKMDPYTEFTAGSRLCVRLCGTIADTAAPAARWLFLQHPLMKSTTRQPAAVTTQELLCVWKKLWR